MAIIYSYPAASAVGTDKVLGIDTSDASKTVVFTIDSIVGAGSAGVFSTATLTGALSAKSGTSFLRNIELNNKFPDEDGEPSQYITFPAVTNNHVRGSVGIGSNALQSETAAANNEWWLRGNNVGIGAGAGQNTTSGVGNVYLGYVAGNAATTAQNNVGIGNNALNSNVSGIANTSLGYTAGWKLTASNFTVNIGSSAGATNNGGSDRTSGSNCVFVGATTQGSANGTTNENVFGHGAVGAGSNTVRLGNTSVTKVTTSGDVETDTVGKGFILKSPDGTRYRITVANGGALSSSAV